MSFRYNKGEFDRYFKRLDRPVEESRPDRQRDRFPSLGCTAKESLQICDGEKSAEYAK